MNPINSLIKVAVSLSGGMPRSEFDLVEVGAVEAIPGIHPGAIMPGSDYANRLSQEWRIRLVRELTEAIRELNKTNQQ